MGEPGKEGKDVLLLERRQLDGKVQAMDMGMQPGISNEVLRVFEVKGEKRTP